MGKVKQVLFTLWITVFFFTGIQVQADTPEIECTVESYSGSIFSPLYESTQAASMEFCQLLIQTRLNDNLNNINIEARELLTGFAEEAQQALDGRPLSAAAEYQDQFSQLEKTFAEFDFSDPLLPEFNVAKQLGTSKVEGYFMPLSGSVNRFAINEVASCASVSAAASCRDVFEDFANAFNPYRSAYNNVYDNTEALDKLGSEWDRFLELSKSQTALEVLLTTQFQRGHFKQNYLVGPPSFQIIALHPHLVYSYMDDAPDGNNQELGLALEWFGINFWDWKVPLGISFTTTYLDRADFDDTGKGVMVHIDNHYAIGWSEHGDEDAVYVTIDLLKMFQQKKQQYQAYMNQYFD